MVYQLIVNADDYGHTDGVSKGIRDAFLNGIVSSTTVMMNMDNAEAALEQAAKDCPDLNIGVHLNVTTGFPLLPSDQVRSLINSVGVFHDNDYYGNNLSEIDAKQVAMEWEAQIKKYIQFTGKSPDHIDAHHHIAFFSSELFQNYLNLAEKYDCGIRFAGGKVGKDLISDFPLSYQTKTTQKIAALMADSSVWCPNHFYRDFYGENSTKSFLLQFLKNLEPGVTELMCHPGYNDAALQSMSIYCKERERELSIFKDEEVRFFLSENHIKLTNYSNEEFRL